MQFRNAVTAVGQFQRENGHGEGFGVRLLMSGDVHEFFAGQTEFTPEFGEVLVDKPEGEFVVAGGDGGMGGEDVLSEGLCAASAKVVPFATSSRARSRVRKEA